MRIWLDPARLAAFDLTAEDVTVAVTRNNVQSAAGTVRGEYLQFYLNPQTSIRDAEGFRQLVVRATPVRSCASVMWHGARHRTMTGTSRLGTRAVFIALGAAISANPLESVNVSRRSFRGSSRNCPMA
jgi:multidrug efflux pump subunit AcrB